MTTYHLSVHKSCGSDNGMETFSSRELQLDNAQDFSHATHLCENRMNMADFWKQTVVPIRTDRASDFFFPALMNMVIKTKSLSENFFAVLGAMIWDLATLPIRFVTFLPRATYNAMATPAEHPLISYLKGKGLSSRDVQGENPVECSLDRNGQRMRFLEKDGRVNVLLYTKEVKDGRVEERSGKKYLLHLTDREIAFPIYEESTFFSRHSLDHRPLPGLANFLHRPANP